MNFHLPVLSLTARKSKHEFNSNAIVNHQNGAKLFFEKESSEVGQKKSNFYCDFIKRYGPSHILLKV